MEQDKFYLYIILVAVLLLLAACFSFCFELGYVVGNINAVKVVFADNENVKPESVD